MIEIKEYTEFNDKEIRNLYDSVEWYNYTENFEMLKNSFAHSLKILGAYDDEKLLGIIRAVGDGYSVLYIQDLLILPEYQRKGIGTKLMKQMDKLYPNIYMTVLLSDESEEPVAFYKSLELKMNSEAGCVAFIKWNTKRNED